MFGSKELVKISGGKLNSDLETTDRSFVFEGSTFEFSAHRKLKYDRTTMKSASLNFYYGNVLIGSIPVNFFNDGLQ